MEINPNQGRIITCKICGKELEHHAKGMCHNCYRKYGWKRKKIICKNCGKEKYHKAFGLCSNCHIKLYHYDIPKAFNCRKLHNISLELYKKITEKCMLCEFDKIVELHHLDEDHKNNSETNLVGLCPNHHKMLHNMRYSKGIKAELENKLKKKNSF